MKPAGKGFSIMAAPPAESTTDHLNPELTLIFVYGSLKRGYALHYLLNSQKNPGAAITKPLYRLFDLGSYPGMIEWPEGLSIHGELYLVDADCLANLDEAEGVAEGYYVRREVLLEPPHENWTAQAWFWLDSVSKFRDCGSSWPSDSESLKPA